MKETQLKELQGASRLTRGFFNRLIRRIECTKPLAGSRITITEQENGIEISSPAPESLPTLRQITLNVCENGVPSTIVVYGP